MAIHVRTDFHWISTPKEYQDKITNLAFIAALAKRLNKEDIFNQAKNAFSDLRNQWDREGSAIAKKNSKTDWLGGGSMCIAEPMMPWELCYNLAEMVVEQIPADNLANELKQALSEK